MHISVVFELVVSVGPRLKRRYQNDFSVCIFRKIQHVLQDQFVFCSELSNVQYDDVRLECTSECEITILLKLS